MGPDDLLHDTRTEPTCESRSGRRRVRHVRFAAAAIVVASLWAMCGCKGSATISLLSLNRQAIDPPRVEPWEFNARECVWWTDEAGQFHLAMRSKRSQPLLGAVGGMELIFSLTPGTPPAGPGRDYTIKPQHVSGVLTSPLFRQRFFAYAGIISVLRDKKCGGRIDYHGSFRIWTTPMPDVTMMTLLPPRRGPVLCYGTFSAVHDPDLGRELQSRTELPTTIPTTAHAATQPAVTTTSAD